MKNVFLACFFYSCMLNAQLSKNYENAPLNQVLSDISAETNILFSYSDEAVSDKTITLNTENSSLDELLALIKEQTGLIFEKISDRQIIVSVPSDKINICGYILDATTKQYLPYATIGIENKNIGTITNEEGFFELKNIEKTAVVTIQHVGYGNTSMAAANLQQPSCQQLSLQIENTLLQEVVIVEYITTGIDKHRNGAILISNERLGILPGQTEPDIFQSMQLISGITSADETATGIQIRGGSPDQNLILWDDIKMYNTGHFFGLLSAFNPYVVKEAKIYKDGADAMYGGRISGVIDISSDSEVPKKFNGGFGANGTHGDLFIKAPIGEKVGIIVSGRRSYTDIIESPTYDAYSKRVFQNTKITSNPQGVPAEAEEEEEEEEELEDVLVQNDFYFYDTSAKLILEATERDKIMVSALLTNNNLAFKQLEEEDVTTDDLKIQNKGFSLSWKGIRKNKIHHGLKTYYSSYDSDYKFLKQESNSIEDETTRKNTVEDFGTDFNLGYQPNDANTFLLGYQFSKNKVFYAIKIDNEYDTLVENFNTAENLSNSIYATYKHFLQKKGIISLGVRGSYYSIVNAFFTEPRIHLEYPFTNSFRVKASGELRYQPISQLVEFENTELRLENNIWIHANAKDIPILESSQVSGGVLFTKKGWHFEMDSYYKNIKGLTSLTNGFNTIQNDLSAGGSTILGVDFFLKKRFKNYSAWLSYTFNSIEYTFTDIQKASFPGNNDIPHNFRFSNAYKIKNWEFSIGWQWRSGTPFTKAQLINNSIEYDAPNNERLPNYHRLDISTLYRFNFSKRNDWSGQVGFSLQNVYHRQVPIAVSYSLDDNPITEEIELKTIQQQSLGMTPNLIVRIYF